jgi:4-hydroxy-3-methylbut-2-enyl diphosphate reductase
MANVKVAESAGFCFGVKRAVEMVYEEVKKEEGPIYTLGPIIHNEDVVRDLEEKGVRIISEGDISDSLPTRSSVIIRSHGISEAVWERLKRSNARVIDATCPYVKKIHQVAAAQSAEGRRILIIGDASHPEVIGICGWIRGKYDVIQDEEDLKNIHLDRNERICIVSQTTFNYDKFQDLVEIIRKLVYDSIVLNTICSATKERQEEASELAKSSDIMLVIGSRSSSNTQKLYSICKAACENTYYIQTLDDLVTVHFHSESLVGITAGASAPNNIIQEVVQYVRGTKF